MASYDEGEYSDDENHHDRGSEPNTMMSIFASYYGIEAEDTKNKLDINSPQFDSEEYVKNLLATQTVEYLVATDVKLVHEIRALDSDMQMLVYENYNKFISATETIKRMKSNVEGMDDDLTSIKSNMSKITKFSTDIDESLHVKRSKLDKILRIRRLLQKLEFLSELPEKLVELIDQEEYKKAVQLYRKTITILTNHSHLLSFRNIKERTEKMMNDLRYKVVNLLDDATLEPTKLTYYANILRLMEAPRDKVLEKLLTVYELQAMSNIQAFKDNITKISIAHTSKDNYISPMNVVRKFHESTMISFQEAIRAINELFEPLPIYHDNTTTTTTDTDDTITVTTCSTSAGEDEEKKAKLAAFTQLSTLISKIFTLYETNILSIIQYFFQRIYYYLIEAHEVEINPNHTKLDTHLYLSPRATTNPFDEDVPTQGERAEEEDENELSQAELHKRIINQEKNNPSNSHRFLSLKLYELEEEKNTWYSTMKTMIRDWELIDTTLTQVMSTTMINTSGNTVVSFQENNKNSTTNFTKATTTATNMVSTTYALTFGTSLSATLEKHTRVQFNFALVKLLYSLKLSVQDMYTISSIKTEIESLKYQTRDMSTGIGSTTVQGYSSGGGMMTAGSTHGSTHGSGHGYGNMHAEATAIKNLFAKKNSEVKLMTDKLVDKIIVTFTKLCQDIKPVLEIVESVRHHQSSISRVDMDTIYAIHGHNIGLQFISMLCHMISLYCENTSTASIFMYSTVFKFVPLTEHMSTPPVDTSINTLQTDYAQGYIYDEWKHIDQPWTITGLPTDTVFMRNRLQSTTSAINTSNNTTTTCNSTSAGKVATTLNITQQVDICDYMKRLWASIINTTTTTNNNTTSATSGTTTVASMNSIMVNVQGFILYGVIQHYYDNIITRCMKELYQVNMLSTSYESILKERSLYQLEMVSYDILMRHYNQNMNILNTLFQEHVIIETSVSDRNSISKSTTDSISNNTPVATTSDICIPESTLHIFHILDFIVTCCCLYWNEPLPVSKTHLLHSSSQQDKYNTINKQRVGLSGTRSGANTLAGVKMDIERLFAQQILIYNPSDICTGKIDALIGSYIKGILKSYEEALRVMIVNTILYHNCQANISFLKQMSRLILQDEAYNEIDRLTEQILMTLFSRYKDANDIHKVNDSMEVVQISKAVVEAINVCIQTSLYMSR